MNICVYGAGAIGGSLAVRLSMSGCKVGVVARGEHADAIRRTGLTLVSGEQRCTVRLPCVARPDELPESPDIVFVTVKQTQLPAIAGQLARLTESGARLILMMNGIPWWFARELPLPPGSELLRHIDPGERLDACIDRRQLSAAVVRSSNEVVEPGVVLATTPERNRIIIGAVESDTVGVLHDRSTEDVCRLLRASGYAAEQSGDIRREIWKKMVLWMAVSPLSALTGMPVDRLASDPWSFDLMCFIMKEMIAIGQGVGIELSADVEETIGFYRDKPARPSLLKDFEVGRKPELASCVLIFDEVAQATGAPAPNVHLLAGLCRLKRNALEDQEKGS
ncbi:2-dehydropantoate 2-reductase [Alcaligenaceae bacterium]|nr:2-dehydropantoate 2-reductase [Alcaligenaceae bacterium]